MFEPNIRERTKYIKINCHFIKEKNHLRLSKSLRGPRIAYTCDKLDACNIYNPS